MALDTFNPYLFVSAGEQSNKFLTPAYADGIAQFQAQRAQELTGLTVRIDPIQEGTEDPAPDNIRPISGRTGLTVTVTEGKNLCGELLQGYWAFADGVPGETETWVKTPKIRCIGGSTYTASSSYVSNWIGFVYYDAYGGYIGADNAGGRRTTYISTAPATAAYMAVNINTGTNGVPVYPGDITDFQLEESAAKTAYEPYNGTSYPVSWQTEAGTVYGGTLDVVSGVLTVDWGYIASYNGETLPGEWISDRDVYAEGTTPTTGAEVAYKLAEPVAYQLDPEQIMTLPGFNQIYSDAGPVIDIKF